ncbi:MAG: hypothetical protein G3M78_02245 [Candidatus Nitrohelix vancouverensis]|uniref:Lipoprotein n=1 Tax=Candidatus Nitrohelix vancouverensis TaxID=2705534 RepID=A0A7T0G2H9_9BACT|nr:MAG: hypothetical protein G3M78_02245 [Candidatus Nitrohelix vancouverensis]
MRVFAVKNSVLVALIVLAGVILSGCVSSRAGVDPRMRFKQITPDMEFEMASYIKRGCDKEYRYLDPEIARLYSVIPGGGQFYTGESGKGWMYLLSSPLLIPYIVSFEDAQNSVDYYNFRYTLEYCRRKFNVKRPNKRENKASVKKSKSSRKRVISKTLKRKKRVKPPPPKPPRQQNIIILEKIEKK